MHTFRLQKKGWMKMKMRMKIWQRLQLVARKEMLGFLKKQRWEMEIEMAFLVEEGEKFGKKRQVCVSTQVVLATDSSIVQASFFHRDRAKETKRLYNYCTSSGIVLAASSHAKSARQLH